MGGMDCEEGTEWMDCSDSTGCIDCDDTSTTSLDSIDSEDGSSVACRRWDAGRWESG